MGANIGPLSFAFLAYGVTHIQVLETPIRVSENQRPDGIDGGTSAAMKPHSDGFRV
jgi:hypothetical protein